MARNEKEKKSARKRGPDTPTIFTAAGLLAFYQEEEAVVKLNPLAVVLISVGFIAAIAVLNLIF